MFVQKQVTARKLAVFLFASPFIVSSLTVHWVDLSTAPPSAFLVAGIAAFLPSSLISPAVCLTALTRHLAPEEVVKGMSVFQTIQQLARLAAPLVGVAIYSAGKRIGGTAGYGSNANLRGEVRAEHWLSAPACAVLCRRVR
jgi:uncharacterized membrane protein YjjB (DUF3815 family)